MSTPCWLNPTMCAAEAAAGAAYEYASESITDWWYGDPEDVGFTTVPDYGESPIDVPATTPRTTPRTTPPASSGAASGNGAAPPPPPPGAGSTLSPLWVGAGVVVLGLGGYYAYRASR